MILSMEKLTLYALSEDRKSILDRLMRLKCVQLIPPGDLEEAQALLTLAKRDEPTAYEYEQKLSEISQALGVLSEYEPKPGLFTQKSAAAFDSLLNLEELDTAIASASAVKGIVANIAEVKSFQSADLFLKQSLLPWKSFDLPLDKLATRFSRVMFYTLPREADLNIMEEETASLACYFESVSADADQHYVAAVTLQSNLAEIQQFFKEHNGLPVSFSGLTGTVADNLSILEERAEQNAENQKVLLESLQARAQDTRILKEAYDRLSIAIAAQKARQNLLLTEKVFFVSAWISSVDKPKADDALAGYNCFAEYSSPSKEDNPPVRFKNNKLVEPFEAITEMYGFPAPDSLDPNPLIAPFFFVFFGMMLSDAGYGILLLVAGWLVSRMVSRDSVMYKLMRMISLCGISTIIWGAIYGGWFGDVVTQLSKTFIGREITIPALINPLEEPMTILIMSLAFGIVHIFVGMGVQAYLIIRRGRWLDAIFDVGFWYLVLGGLVVMLLGMVSGGSEGMVFKIGMWSAIVGGAGLLLTGGRDKPSFFGKITGGLGKLYSITGYFSDVLSYSRILALGLATGVIAMVINILATMAGGGILGAIVFIVVFLFGHALNLGINALGSYVHTSRLQYVEFFGKFYEGGGRPFLPFKAQTKYHRIQSKEEM